MARQVNAPNPSGTASKPEARKPSLATLNWLLRYKYEGSSGGHNRMRTLLLVVSALIASVTFQAGVSPPGGVWQSSGDGHIAGNAIYASRTKPFYAFLVFNTLALSSSVFVIRSLTFMFPFSLEIWTATLAMVITYGTSIFAITPHQPDYKFRYVLIPSALPLLVRFLVQLCRYLKRRYMPGFQWSKLFGTSK